MTSASRCDPNAASNAAASSAPSLIRQQLNEQLDWIPRDPTFKSTNDFVWVSHGRREVGLKSPKARYETIHGQIVKAASRAAKHRVIKENFVIDIGDEPMTDDLRAKLSEFNVGRRKYRLRDLWVMAQGQLHRIELRE